MTDHLIFLFYKYIFLISTIGHGILFCKLFIKDFLQKNIGYLGIIGFFSLSVYSILTSFFIAHNEMHNTIIHFIGVVYFVIFFINQKERFKEFKVLFVFSIVLIIGAYVFKNHDDFSYYHLTYSLNLSENSFIVGTGIFSHGFRTFSSLFYYHSLLYMPYIEFYLFHIGPYFILIFFNLIVFEKLSEFKSLENSDFIFYFSLLSFIFVNVVFYRIGEHGTDRSAQILLLLIFITFFELILSKKNSKKNIIYLNLLILFIFLASSMKAIYYLYFLIVPFVIFYRKLVFLTLKFLFCFKFCFFLSIFLNLLTYYLNTGCLLYPAKISCIGNPSWQIPIQEVEKMKIHYEWWAKAGGGPGYISEIPKEKYIDNFNWLPNWIERHFFNKVSDTVIGIIFICILLIVTIKIFSKKKKKSNLIPGYIYFFPIIFLLEWFLNHPSMRYGGYVLFAIPIFMFTSSYLSKLDLKMKRLLKISFSFIIISLLLFNIRNFVRINKESEIYGYDLIKSPFFYIEETESRIIHEEDNFKIYTTKDGKSCWASMTPCSYYKDIRVEKFLWMKVVLRDVK